MALRVSQRLADGLTSFAQTLAREIAGSGPVERASSQDGVENSSGAELTGGPHSLTHVHRLAQRRLDEFLVEFRGSIASEDIDWSEPIELKSDGRGGVILARTRPDRAALEDYFASTPGLAAAFHRLAAAVTTAAKIQLPSGRRLDGEFRLIVSQSDAEIRFE